MSSIKKHRYNVEITESDIRRATKKDSTKCVVAQAIARALPSALRIAVDTQAIRFTHLEERLVYLTPALVQRYVVAFDAGDEIEPFRFQLRDPVQVKRRVYTEEGKNIERARSRERAARPAPAPVAVQERPAPAPVAVQERPAPAPVKQTTVDRLNPKAPPLVFKTKMRTYGSRILRANKARGEAGSV